MALVVQSGLSVEKNPSRSFVPEATTRVTVSLVSPSTAKIRLPSSRIRSGDFSSANAGEKSNPSANAVSKELIHV
jgi:hypothetical protein